jgi:hypothetical protein
MTLAEIILLSIAGLGFVMLLAGLYGQRMPLKYRSIRSDKIFGYLSSAGAVLMILGLVIYKFFL